MSTPITGPFVMSTLEADKRGIPVQYYDSIYSAIPEEAQNSIAGLVPQQLLKSFQLRVESMATQKQAGVTDCGLYAIAICTSLAFQQNPCLQVFVQEDMRSHLIN